MKHSQSGSALGAAICFIFSATLLTLSVLAMSKYHTFTIRPHLELQKSFYLGEGAANRIQWLIAADRELHSTAIPGQEDYSEYEYDRYLADGVDHTIDYHGTPVNFRITDARSGFDFSSSAWRSTLSQIKSQFNTDTGFVENLEILQDLISDYSDFNDAVDGDGMEAPDYESENKIPLPANTNLQYREELFYIPGFLELFPTDNHGRLTSIRLIPPDNMANLRGTPSIFTADKFQLMVFGGLEEEETEPILEALNLFRTERINLEDQLDIDQLLPLRARFSWQESGYYTVTIQPDAGAGIKGKRLSFTFQGFGVDGPRNEMIPYLQWIFY